MLKLEVLDTWRLIWNQVSCFSGRHSGGEYKTTSPSHPQAMSRPWVISQLCSSQSGADPSQTYHPIKSPSLLSPLLARNPTAGHTLTRSLAWERRVQLQHRWPGLRRGRLLCRNRRGWHPLQEKEILYRGSRAHRDSWTLQFKHTKLFQSLKNKS